MSSTISSFSLSSILRQTVQTAQSNLATDEQEMSTGVYANIGLTLGAQTSQDVALRAQQSLLQTISASNATVSTTLSSTQNILSNLQSTGQTFLQSLVQGTNNDSTANVLQSTAMDNLQSLLSQLNTNVNGEFLFGGINSSVAPMTSYVTGAANQQSVANAFQSTFGFSQSSPSVSTITASQMQSFLTTQFPTLFQGADWTSNWSAASDVTNVSQISPSQTVTTSVSANQTAFQQLAQAYTMVADLGTSNLNTDAYNTVVTQAESLMQSALAGLTNIQGGLGTAQAAITSADTYMSTQLNTLSTQIGALENVDTYAVSSQETELQTQIETAYELTSQLQQLSLTKYL